MKMIGINSPTQHILRISKLLRHKHVSGVSSCDFSKKSTVIKKTFSSKKVKNYKDETLKKSNRTLFDIILYKKQVNPLKIMMVLKKKWLPYFA